MRLKDYIRERRLFFFILFLAALFCGLIVWSNGDKLGSGAYYMLEGLGGLCAIYIIIDYFTLRSRINRIHHFFRNGAADNETFSYPLDIIYSGEAGNMAEQYNSFKSKAREQYSEELDFITRWVHDIKVPISALYLLTENLCEDDAQKLEMQIAFIEQHTQKVLYHIKSNSFEDDFQITNADTLKIIKTALKQYAVFFAQKKISLELGKDSFEVLTDEKWSGYIVSQFLSNAVKHTPDYGSIAIKTSSQNNRIVICIRNTGEGIAPENLDNIFSRGYTASSTRSSSFSTGYGLYLSKKLAERMGHEVYAVSKAGEYTEFYLSFRKNSDITKM